MPNLDGESVAGPLRICGGSRVEDRDPKSILQGYPYIIGVLYKGAYMGYPHPNFCLRACWGPFEGLIKEGLGFT